MAVGWVPCASRLGQKRRIKTAISPPTQRKKSSGGAASAGGRPLCVERLFWHSSSLWGTEWAEGKSREEMHEDAFFSPSFLVIGCDSGWTLNILKRQETTGTNAGSSTSPNGTFKVICGRRGTAPLLVTSAESPTATRGPPSAHHLDGCTSLSYGLRVISFLVGRGSSCALVYFVNNRFGLQATVWSAPINMLSVGKKWLHSRLKSNNVCKCLKVFNNTSNKTSVCTYPLSRRLGFATHNFPGFC